MGNQVRHYDTGAMRTAAAEIRSKIGAYKSARDEINTAVTTMGSYWDDPVNQSFVKRYNQDLKETALSVQNLMEEYAKFLEETAKAYDEAIAKANAGING